MESWSDQAYSPLSGVTNSQSIQSLAQPVTYQHNVVTSPLLRVGHNMATNIGDVRGAVDVPITLLFAT
jgi:hypothetical protein